MKREMEAPSNQELSALLLDYVSNDEPWVVTVQMTSQKGDIVKIAWDQIAGSVHVVHSLDDKVGLVIEREAATKISFSKSLGAIEVSCFFELEGLSGKLTIRVGENVEVFDAMLLT